METQNNGSQGGSDDYEMNALLARLVIAVARIKQEEAQKKPQEKPQGKSRVKPQGKGAGRGSRIHRGDGLDSVRDFIADDLRMSVQSHLGGIA